MNLTASKEVVPGRSVFAVLIHHIIGEWIQIIYNILHVHVILKKIHIHCDSLSLFDVTLYIICFTIITLDKNQTSLNLKMFKTDIKKYKEHVWSIMVMCGYYMLSPGSTTEHLLGYLALSCPLPCACHPTVSCLALHFLFKDN